MLADLSHKLLHSRIVLSTGGSAEQNRCTVCTVLQLDFSWVMQETDNLSIPLFAALPVVSRLQVYYGGGCPVKRKREALKDFRQDNEPSHKLQPISANFKLTILAPIATTA